MKPRQPDHRIHIRRASLTDLPAIVALERQSATAAHWSEEQYRAVFQADRGGRLALVAEASERRPTHPALFGIAGFLIAQQISSDWELENIVVDAKVRCTGIGRRLMDALLAVAHESNGSGVFLEVRESNTAARTLYERTGFTPAGRRKSYYSNPLEDAILYRRRVQQ